MYSFDKSADEEMIDLIDCEELRQKLQIMYKAEGEKLEFKLKKIIKNEKKFLILLEEMHMTDRELFFIMAKTFPNIFNHRLIKYIRKEYFLFDE